MNYVEIADVNVPTKGIGKYFSILLLNLELPGTTPSFYWEVKDEVVHADSEEKYPNRVVLNGNLYMTSEEYSQWGTDDNYVIDWALQKLNFTRL
jgi:hypothetical protein